VIYHLEFSKFWSRYTWCLCAVLVLITVHCKTLSSSPEHPDWLLYPPRYLLSGYRCSFLEVNRPECELNCWPLSSVEVKKEWNYTHSAIFRHEVLEFAFYAFWFRWKNVSRCLSSLSSGVKAMWTVSDLTNLGLMCKDPNGPKLRNSWLQWWRC
jgi:hypothetical protein